MATIYTNPLALHFGLGFPLELLPPDWKLIDSREGFAIGLDPSGQEHFLSSKNFKAYPSRIAGANHPHLTSGERYLDEKAAVIDLSPALRPSATSAPLR